MVLQAIKDWQGKKVPDEGKPTETKPEELEKLK